MLEELKQKAYKANMELPRRGLITYTQGDVSRINREKGLFVIKLSGVDCDVLKPSDMVVIGLEGNKAEGEVSPSSDAATHVELCNAFKEIGGTVHTHSPHTMAQAQVGRTLPRYDTAHAGHFYDETPCARNLTAEEVEEGYGMSTREVIIETLQGKNPVYISAVLCKNHGPFTWRKDTAKAVHNAVVLEEVTRMNFMTRFINPQAGPVPQCMQDKHFMRRHGPNTYYGRGR